ncbi:MAG: hypothetical protein OH316_02065 [Candidatus Parvarchaeota archaeon]|nr:hypothetical protein [Candidatus Parvarchaeota archaeon]
MIELSIFLGEKVIFALLAILGLIGAYYAMIILRVLFKHREDKAPMTSMLLNPERRKVSMLVYFALFVFLTGAVSLIEYMIDGDVPVNNLDFILYFVSFVFGLLSAVFAVMQLHFWYSRFRRFI